MRERMAQQTPGPGRRPKAVAARAPFALLALLLLLAPSAEATGFALASSAGAATIVPVTLAAPGGNSCNGSCAATLNAAATSLAVGTMNILPNPSQARQVAKVVHGSLPWSVQVRATGVQGLVLADSIVLSLAGATTATLTLQGSTALPAQGGTVALAGGSGAADLSLTARGTCAGLCVLSLELVLTSGSARYAYSVALTVT